MLKVLTVVTLIQISSLVITNYLKYPALRAVKIYIT